MGTKEDQKGVVSHTDWQCCRHGQGRLPGGGAGWAKKGRALHRDGMNILELQIILDHTIHVERCSGR